MTITMKERRMYRRSLSPPNRPAKTHRITVRLTEEEHNRLKALSLKKRQKVSVLIRHYVRNGMKENV